MATVSRGTPVQYAGLPVRSVNSAASAHSPFKGAHVEDVGYVTRPVTRSVFIWNGGPAPLALTAIEGNEDAEGITWNVKLPCLIAPGTSQRINITVGVDGPLEYTAVLRFLSGCAAVPFLTIVGTRPPQMAGDIGYLFFPHDWTDGLDETLAWKTDVMVAHDRTEQRVQLRTHPRRAWNLRLLAGGDGRRKLETWLGLRRTRRMFAPVWRDEARLAEPVTVGATVIPLEKPQLLDYEKGRWLALYNAWDHFEIHQVAGIGAGYVALETPLARNWPAHTLAAPCRYGLAIESRRLARFTEDAAEFRVHFEALDESLMPVMQSPDLYRDLPLCPLAPSWVNDGEEGMDNKWVRLDNETGLAEFAIQSIEPVRTRQARFLVIGRDRIDLMLRFLCACAGRLAPFWIPAAERGFELAAPALAGAQDITDIELAAVDGRIMRRRISKALTLPTGHEQLSLSEPLDFDVSAATLNRCAWLQACRLDSDEISLKWWGGDCLEVTVPLVVLP